MIWSIVTYKDTLSAAANFNILITQQSVNKDRAFLVQCRSARANFTVDLTLCFLCRRLLELLARWSLNQGEEQEEWYGGLPTLVRPKLWWMEAREEQPLGNHFLVVCGLFSAVTILMMKAHPLVVVYMFRDYTMWPNKVFCSFL